jgi:tetratricopeptide (TPR) repeat protein
MKKHLINLIQKGIVIIGVAVAFNRLPPAVYAQSPKMLIAQNSAEDFLDQEIDKESDFLYQGAEKFNRKDYRGAIADFNQAIRLKPNDAQPYYNRGLAHSRLGAHTGAISDYNQALRLNPKFTDAYTDRGWDYYELGNYKQAISDCNNAIELDPKYARAYYHRGIVYAAEGNYKQSIADYNKAIELKHYPLSWPYYTRGLARSKLGDRKGAIEDYNQALREDPNYAEAYLSRGYTLAVLGKFHAALMDFNQAIRLKSNLPEAYYSRGVVRFALEDNKEGAMVDLQQAADLFLKQGRKEDHQRVINTIRKLNNLISSSQTLSALS